MTSKIVTYFIFIIFLTPNISTAFDLKSLGKRLEDTVKSADKKKNNSNDHEKDGRKVERKNDGIAITDNDADKRDQANSDSIQPFGNILWTDSFVEVISKLNALKPDTLILARGRNRDVNLKGSIDKDTLSKKLIEDLVKRSPGPDSPSKKIFSLNLGKYKDARGIEKSYINVSSVIVASPVMISGVPFELEAHFTTSPGLLIYKPENVLIGSKRGYTYPLVLDELTLYSNSVLLDADKSKEIRALIIKKYGKYTTKKMRKYIKRRERMGRTLPIKRSFGDGKGSGVSMSSGAHTIAYGSDAYLKELAEKYRKHLVSLETSEMKNKKDMKSGL